MAVIITFSASIPFSEDYALCASILIRLLETRFCYSFGITTLIALFEVLDFAMSFGMRGPVLYALFRLQVEFGYFYAAFGTICAAFFSKPTIYKISQ